MSFVVLAEGVGDFLRVLVSGQGCRVNRSGQSSQVIMLVVTTSRSEPNEAGFFVAISPV